jgi:hypothetical protein
MVGEALRMNITPGLLTMRRLYGTFTDWSSSVKHQEYNNPVIGNSLEKSMSSGIGHE